jgi:hypothetical protein
MHQYDLLVIQIKNGAIELYIFLHLLLITNHYQHLLIKLLLPIYSFNQRELYICRRLFRASVFLELALESLTGKKPDQKRFSEDLENK